MRITCSALYLKLNPPCFLRRIGRSLPEHRYTTTQLAITALWRPSHGNCSSVYCSKSEFQIQELSTVWTTVIQLGGWIARKGMRWAVYRVWCWKDVLFQALEWRWLIRGFPKVVCRTKSIIPRPTESQHRSCRVPCSERSGPETILLPTSFC